MKIKILTRAAILFVLGACTKDPALVVEREISAMVPTGTDEIQIMEGSGDYSLRVEDDEIVTAEILRAGKVAIRVRGIKLGETRVSVKDNASGREKQIRVKVIPGNEHVTLKVQEAFLRPNTSFNAEFLSGVPKNVILYGVERVVLLPARDKVYLFKDEDALQKGDYLHEGSFRLIETWEPTHFATLEMVIGGRGYLHVMNESSYAYLYMHLNSIDEFYYNSPHVVQLHQDLKSLYAHLLPDEDEISMIFTTNCVNAYLSKIPPRFVFEP